MRHFIAFVWFFLSLLLLEKVIHYIVVNLFQCHLQVSGIIYIQEMQTLKQRLQKLQLDKDPYLLLQCQAGCDFSEVKKNYRGLALKYHPDRNKDEEATHIFIKISRAYQFLSEEQNRKLYADHIRALAEQQQRIDAMDDERKRLIQNLKRRQEEFIQRKTDEAAQLRRRKQFFQKMEREEQQKEKLKSSILKQMNPKQFYEKLSSIEVKWEPGLSFTEKMFQSYFSDYAQVIKVNIEQKRRQAVVVINSIQKAALIVQQFDHPLLHLDLKIKGNDRTRLLGALQKRKTGGDLSLSTENIQRLKQMMNRESNLYLRNNNR